MTKKKSLIYVVILAGALMVIISAVRTVFLPPPSKINPQIFPEFRRIENECMLITSKQLAASDTRYKACEELLLFDSKKHEVQITADDYYKYLLSLGFQLPPLELESPPSKKEFEKALAEQKHLLEIRKRLRDGTQNDL